ncbi:hypothetical protein QQS21_011318 [Conoideocrella luteorostrata]|uniref:Survival Motor Neuron Gemin2-binding domain-containing protein n=1 Tax=Conoideocrella luteorostrata TaxID=1105319 RepID=A0AAJ0CDC6_9HYPO|nr:hypothetical protein QQS21_011318 [Conoideocrella luteorostrata]
MGGEQENLSHEEVWDDSALIDSWNEALAEYKKYHSIHAKGGSIRDLQPKDLGNVGHDQVTESKEASDGAEAVSSGNEDPDHTVSKAKHAATASTPAAPPPQALLGSIRDEGLKKLLMSWYYAGYYTGLFEGQQQTQQTQDPQS